MYDLIDQQGHRSSSNKLKLNRSYNEFDNYSMSSRSFHPDQENHSVTSFAKILEHSYIEQPYMAKKSR